MELAYVLGTALYVSVLVQTVLGGTSETDPISTTPTGECVLPPQPEFSKYTVPVCSVSNTSTECQAVAGSIVPQYWLLNFTCDEGYYFDEGGPNVQVFCVNSSWMPSIPVCRRWCKPLKPLNVDIHCEHKGKEIDCTKAVPFGTEASGHCSVGYEPTGRAATGLTVCKDDGQWSHHDLLRCVPDCGRKDPDSPLIKTGSVVSEESLLPWFVGIYRMNDMNELEHYCGGTLISSHIVLTAGHCVYSEADGQVLSPQKIKVALGKRFRNWTHDEPGAVKSEVREIALSPLYSGRRTSYAHDIALIDLTTNVPFNSYVRPACVDWDREIGVTSGQLGTLTGWGRTENHTKSETLVSIQLPYENTRKCISKAPATFQHYITTDKFCSTLGEGKRVTPGYGGGGLTFDSDGRQYIQGILSTKIPDIITFTSLKDVGVLNWLQEAKRTFDEAHQQV